MHQRPEYLTPATTALRWLVALACMVLITLGHAHSAPAPLPVPLDALPGPTFPAPLWVLDDASRVNDQATLEQVRQLPASAFVPFSSRKLYAIAHDKPLWLRLRVSQNQKIDYPQWLLEFPISVIDRFEVYQLGSQGQWEMGAAGDYVAHTQWPMHSLQPRFPLQSHTLGESDVYVRVVHRVAVNLAPVIVHMQNAPERDTTQMLVMGVMAGVICTLLLICLQMGWAYRDLVYIWYAGYLFFTLMAATCYAGVAQKILWPHATKFASDAIVVGVMLALAFNLQFGRVMFGGLQRTWVHTLVKVLMVLCVAYAALKLYVDAYQYIVPVYITLFMVSFGMILYLGFSAWRRGIAFGGYWLLVYSPFVVSLALTILDGTGIINGSWLPSFTPMPAATLEAIAMMFLINAHGRTRHAQQVREQEANVRDPLTGFLHESKFMSRTARIWQQARKTGRDVTIVYLSVEPKQLDITPLQAEAFMLRSVRMVRTSVRQFDSVGRLGPNLLGIAMQDVPQNDLLSQRLSRLVALGLMNDPQDKTSITVNFTMAVGSFGRFRDNFSALDTALRALLTKEMPGKTKPIRFLSEYTEQHAGTAPSSSTADTLQLTDSVSTTRQL